MQKLEFEPYKQGRQNRDFDIDALAGLRTPVADAMVQRDCLFGTQTLFQYSQGKRRRVNRIYKNPHSKPLEVERFLKEHPVIACPIPVSYDKPDPSEIAIDTPVKIALLGGHNRVRFAPAETTTFPTKLVTPQQGAELYNTSVEDFFQTVVKWTDETIIDFTRANPNMRNPNLSRLERRRNGFYVATPARRQQLTFSS